MKDESPGLRKGAMIHHIALACDDVERQTQFYTSLGFNELSRHHDDRGLRSVWLDCHPTILMLERADHAGKKKSRPFHDKEAGFHLLAFAIDADAADAWRDFLEERELLAGESGFTLYAFDAERNRIAFSSYPDQLRRRPESPDSNLRPLPDPRS